MVKLPGRPASWLQSPGTLPLQALLEQCSCAIENARKEGVLFPRHALSVATSAALTPAIGFRGPLGLRRWTELGALAEASAARELGLPPDAIVCRMDPAAQGVAAASTAQLMTSLQAWVSTLKYQSAQIEPLWSRATACRAASAKSIRGVVVHELDCVTALVEVGRGKLKAHTLSQGVQSLDSASAVDGWITSQGLDQGELLRLRFGDTEQAAKAELPSFARGLWSVA